jgi:site-specific DNA recombinase
MMQRCAIYTRKSSEEGLEQAFNSLHAQREACEAYIRSQQHEGWRVVRKGYDDGGYSGGSMNRPALQEMLAAVERHEIDVIVVYKVDRLTRALSDFAKIVELLDGHGISFVSVTQQFNTTSSMGRLTLNVLLSFAQFEREVTAERIRDKIAVSKRKGMCMGGRPPLGYDMIDKKLVINEAEAKTVNGLFELYLDQKTVRRLKEEADRLSLVTKKRRDKNSKVTGGKPFTRGNLYEVLSNPIYIGMVRHKEKVFPGQHEAIIDQATWDAAQRLLSGNAADRSYASNSPGPFLLTGKVFDETGDLLVQAQTAKGNKRYRYYISKRLMHEAHKHQDGWRLPPSTLETAITTAVLNYLEDTGRLIDELVHSDQDVNALRNLEDGTSQMRDLLLNGEHLARRDLLQNVIERIDLTPTAISITCDRGKLREALGIKPSGENSQIEITVPIRMQRRGVEARLIINKTGTEDAVDPDLCKLIAQARVAFDLLADGKAANLDDLSKQIGLHRNTLSRILPLAFLAPPIVEDILAGKQPSELTAKALKELSPLPACWNEQREILAASA